MNIINTKLQGVRILEPDVLGDVRGSLTKPFHKDTFTQIHMDTDFEESFYSISHKSVIRGMHFQVPPQDHSKLVYVPYGSILDVVLDIRKSSPAYGQFISVELSGKNHRAIYIPRGCAHGFLSLEDDSCTIYMQSTMRSAKHEAGIHPDSFGMDWGIEHPILSQRDQAFPSFAKLDTPFE